MLGFVGFFITGLVIIAYALTSAKILPKLIGSESTSYVSAHIFLGAAFLGWGLSTLLGSEGILEMSILVGTFLLFVATVLMSNVIFKKSFHLVLSIALLIGMAAMVIRSAYFDPTAYISGGLLHFDTHAGLAIVLGILFVTVWLPVNIKIANKMSEIVLFDDLRIIYASIYSLATLSAVLFLGARRDWVIIATFVIMGVCFALLLLSNIFINKVGETERQTDNDPNQTGEMPESPIRPASTPANSPSILSKQPKSTNYSLIVAGLFVLTFAVPGLGFFTIPTIVYFLFMSAKKPEIGYRQAGTDNAGRQLYVSDAHERSPIYVIFKTLARIVAIVAITFVAFWGFVIISVLNSDPGS